MQNNSAHAAFDWDDDDDAIHTALRDVVAPVGSLDRARARLLKAVAADASLVQTDRLAMEQDELAGPTAAIKQAAKPRLLNRRRVASLAVAASIAAIGLFLVQRSSPLTGKQLGAYCELQLNAIMQEQPTWIDVNRGKANLDSLLKLSSTKLELIGLNSRPALHIAGACQVWKLRAQDGTDIYIFDFQAARDSSGITTRLDALTGSGGTWSMAAIRQDDRVLVVAVQGNYQKYFQPARLA